MGTVAQIIAYPGGFTRMLIIKKILTVLKDGVFFSGIENIKDMHSNYLV